MPDNPNPDTLALVSYIAYIASAAPSLILYAWAFVFARRHREGRPTAYSLAVRGLGLLVAGEFLRVGLSIYRFAGDTADASFQSIALTNLAFSILLAGPPFVGTYLLVRAIYTSPTDV